MSSTPAMPAVPAIRRLRVGFQQETWGEITLDAHDTPHFSGPNQDALRELYASVPTQPRYQGLTPPQTLAQMALKMSGPTWAVAIGTDGAPYALDALRPTGQEEPPTHG